MRILLLGASGFVGGGLWARLAPRHEVVATGLRARIPGLFTLDLLDTATLCGLAADRFDLVIHAAGVVDLAAAERDPRTAWAVNVNPIEALVRAVPESTRIVMLSSDNVFAGTRAVYTELDQPAPINVYGHTKVAAEAVLRGHPRHLVVRIPMVFGRSPSSDRFLARFSAPTTPAQVDVVCAPVYLPSLAADLERLWHHTGVVHYGGTDTVSRYELMCRCQAALELPTRVVPVAESGPVRRPRRLVLRSARHDLMGPDLDTALRHMATVDR